MNLNLPKTPSCPICLSPMVCFWGKRKKLWSIYHSTRHCALRFELFGEGETEDLAWEECRQILQNFQIQTSTN